MPKTRNHLTPAEAEAKGLLCCKHLKERHRLMPEYPPSWQRLARSGRLLCV